MNAPLPSEFVLGHRTCITSVAIGYDGGTCSGGYDGFVIARTQQQDTLWRIRLPELVNGIEFSPCGQLVAAACADAFAYVLCARTGATVQRLGPHGDDVNTAIFTPDGRQLLTACDDRDPLIRAWALADGRLLRVLQGHEGAVTSLSLSKDGRVLVSSGEDRSALVWDLPAGTVTTRLSHPADPETSALSCDNRSIATGANDARVRLWSLEGTLLVQKTLGAAVRCVRFSDDGNELLAASYAGDLHLLRLPDLAETGCLRTGRQWERSVAQRGSLIAVASFGAQPALYRDRVPQSDSTPTAGVNALAVAGRRLIAAGDAGRIIDVARPAVALHEVDTIVNCLAASDENGLCAAGTYRGELVLAAMDGGGTVLSAQVPGGPLNCMAWTSADRLVVGSYDGCIREFDTQARLLRCVQAHTGPVKSLAFDARCGLLVSGSADSSIATWCDQRLVRRVSHPGMTLVNAVAIAGDARRVVSASRDRRLRLWCLDTGCLLEELAAVHARSAKAVAIDQDATTIVSGAYDGQALVWHRRGEGWAAHSLQHHGRPGVSSVALAGNDVVTAGWDGSVARWTASASGTWSLVKAWSAS